MLSQVFLELCKLKRDSSCKRAMFYIFFMKQCFGNTWLQQLLTVVFIIRLFIILLFPAFLLRLISTSEVINAFLFTHCLNVCRFPIHCVHFLWYRWYKILWNMAGCGYLTLWYLSCFQITRYLQNFWFHGHLCFVHKAASLSRTKRAARKLLPYDLIIESIHMLI